MDGQATDIHAQNRSGVLLGLDTVRRHLDAAGLAATADLDLGLDHTRVADVVGRVGGLLDTHRVTAGGDRHAVAREQLLSLVLEQIHRRPAL